MVSPILARVNFSTQEFIKRYSAKYIIPGRITPMYHIIGITMGVMLTVKYIGAGRYKHAQKVEREHKMKEFYHKHHGDGGHH